MTLENNNVEVPEHLCEKLFETAMREGFNEPDIKIKKLSFSMGSSPGENYCSDIYRVQVTYDTANEKNKEQWLIVKHLTFADKVDTMEAMDIYRKEVGMYKKAVPQIEALFKDTKFAPKCLYVTDKPVKMMIFQDLNALGYKIGDRLIGLGLDECKVLISKIAKFHAGSMVVAEKDPCVFDGFREGIFSEKSMETKIFQTYFPDNLTELIETANYWPGYENIVQKMKNMHKNFNDLCMDHVQPKPGQINVLNHGDLWVNNFLIKQKNGKPLDIIFVDLQISFYSSPGIDVNYFLNTSLQIDVLKNHRNELVELYCNTLIDTLKEISYKSVPSFRQVKAEIDAKEFYGFITCIGSLPIIAMEKKYASDNTFELFTNEDELSKKRKHMFSSPRLQETLKFSLRRFDELKVFDI